MDRVPFFSVIMPVYNGMPYLQDSIRAVINQSFRDWELIIADDQSPDDSARAVKELQEAYPKASIRYFLKPDKVGFSPARVRNFAISKATGKWLAFLDQDDLWEPDRLEKHYAIISADAEARLIHNDQIFIDAKGNRLSESGHIASHARLNPSNVSGECFSTLFEGNFFGLSCVCLRRNVLDEFGGFNENIFGTEDYDLFLRVTARYPVHYIDHPLTYWRTHGTNMSRNGILMTENLINSLKNICASGEPQLESIRGIVPSRFFFLHCVLARMLAEKGEMAKARRNYREALRYKPFAAGTWLRLIFPRL